MLAALSRLALLTPLMPKLRLVEGVYVYPLEMLLILFFPVFLLKPRVLVGYQIQRWLIAFWLWMLVTTMLSLIWVPNIVDMLRVVKGIVYVPLVAIGARMKASVRRLMVLVGTAALLLNLLLYAAWIVPTYGLDPWIVESSLAGMNNKYFDMTEFQLGVIPRGAAGIWGSYGVLVLVMAIDAYRHREINPVLLYVLGVLLSIQLILSISRETMLVLAVTLGLGLLWLRNRQVLRAALALGLLVFCGVGLAGIAGFKLPFADKLAYTAAHLARGNLDPNALARLNVWRATFLAFMDEPWRLLVGFGYNQALYAQSIRDAAEKAGLQRFATVPESAFWLALGYGGVPAFLVFVGYIISALRLALRSNANVRSFFGPYLVGVVIANLLAGASMIGDQLYGQMLLVMGMLYGQHENVYKRKSFMDKEANRSEGR